MATALRRGTVLVVALVLSLCVLLERMPVAEAYDPGTMGSATTAGVAICAGSAGTLCAAGAAVVVGAAAYYGTTSLLKWIWGGDHTLEQGTPAGTGPAAYEYAKDQPILAHWDRYHSPSATVGYAGWYWHNYPASSTTTGGSWVVRVPTAYKRPSGKVVEFCSYRNGGTLSGCTPSPNEQQIDANTWQYTWSNSMNPTLQDEVFVMAGYDAATSWDPSILAPQHKWRAVGVCTYRASGSPVGVGPVYSAVFREADASKPGMPVPACPSGAYLSSYTVYEGGADGSGGAQVLTWTAPSTWQAPSTSDYADCMPNGGSAYPCLYTLYKVTPTGLQNCELSSVDCTDYDYQTSTQQQYVCKWGAYTVDTADCVAKQEQTSTGTPQPSPSSSPQMGYPVESSADEDECWPSGWGWLNPVSWVLRPVKCALKWAFVPDATALETEVDALQEAWDDTAPATAISTVGDVMTAMGGISDAGGGCEGPEVDLPSIHLANWHPMSACEEPMATVAHWVHLLGTLSVYVGAVVLVVRLFGASVGLHLPIGSRSDD